MAQTNQNNQESKEGVRYPKIKMGRDTYLKEDVEEVHVIYDIHDDSAWFIIYKNGGGESLEKAYYSDIQRFIKVWKGVPIIEFVDDGCSCTPLTKEVKFEWNGWEHSLKRGKSDSFPWGIYREGSDFEMLSISKYSVRSAKKALQSHWDWVHEPFEGDVF